MNMNSFPFNALEDDFRWVYQQIYERTCACYNATLEENPCSKTCHYLIANEITDDGFPPVYGIDCKVSVLCWGGDDIDNSTIEAYCKHCAADQERYDRVERRPREVEFQELQATKQKQLENEERQKRILRDFWLSLSAIEFENHCAKLFLDLGFTAETTAITNDGAIDFLLHKGGKRGAAQCQAWIQPCGVKELREFNGALHAEGMSFGYFIARSGITRSARLLLEKTPLINYWDIDDLLHHALRHK